MNQPEAAAVSGATRHLVFAAHDLGGQSAERVGFERVLLGSHFVQHTTESPDIGLKSIPRQVCVFVFGAVCIN